MSRQQLLGQGPAVGQEHGHSDRAERRVCVVANVVNARRPALWE